LQGSCNSLGQRITANEVCTYAQAVVETNNENDQFVFGSGYSEFIADFGFILEIQLSRKRVTYTSVF